MTSHTDFSLGQKSGIWSASVEGKLGGRHLAPLWFFSAENCPQVAHVLLYFLSPQGRHVHKPLLSGGRLSYSFCRVGELLLVGLVLGTHPTDTRHNLASVLSIVKVRDWFLCLIPLFKIFRLLQNPGGRRRLYCPVPRCPKCGTLVFIWRFIASCFMG